MNDGLAMLIDRMKTNPEEFIAESQYGVTKWGNLLNEYRPYLEKEDLEVFDVAHKEAIFTIMKQRFTEKVMEELVDPKSRDGMTLSSISHPGGTTWGNRSPLSSTLDAQKLQTEQMRLHLEAHRLALKRQIDTPIAGVTQTV